MPSALLLASTFLLECGRATRRALVIALPRRQPRLRQRRLRHRRLRLQLLRLLQLPRSLLPQTLEAAAVLGASAVAALGVAPLAAPRDIRAAGRASGTLSVSRSKWSGAFWAKTFDPRRQG